MSLGMYLLGKQSFFDMYVRSSAQLLGGLLAFPLFALAARECPPALGLQPLDEFGGPSFEGAKAGDGATVDGAAWAEFAAAALLAMGIYLLNFTLNFGKSHYWIKQVSERGRGRGG